MIDLRRLDVRGAEGRAWLDQLRPRVGVMILDPPYGIKADSGFGRRTAAQRRATRIEGDHSTELRDELLGWAAEHEIPVACFGSPRAPRPVPHRQVLVWSKGSCAGMGDLAFPWRLSHEEITIHGDGWHTRAAPRAESVLRIETPHAGSVPRWHPHEKPVALLVHLLERAPEGLVLDPCCGSGSTLLAARMLGRDAAGADLSDRHVATARSRLGQCAFSFVGEAFR